MTFISRALTRHISILVSDLRVIPLVDPYLVNKSWKKKHISNFNQIKEIALGVNQIQHSMKAISAMCDRVNVEYIKIKYRTFYYKLTNSN